MSQSDMIIFNQDFMPAIIETLDQMIDKFNAASGGAIQLQTASNIGDYINESFYDAIHSSQRRVDRYAAQGAVAATDLTQSEHVSVKIAGGFGPIRYEPAQMTWLRKPTNEGIEVASRNFAEAVMQDQLNTAILSLVTAIENQAALVEDVSGGASITQRVLNDSHAKFGDHSQTIVTQVMRGTTWHSLVDQGLANAERLFVAGNVTVMDILGKSIVITDAPALLNVTPDPDQEKVLSLTQGAAVVRDPNDPIVNIETNNGQTRIETTLQMDYDFTLGLKGYAWDKTNGGASPDDTDLGTGTNWDKVVTSDKHTAGVIAIGDVA